MNCREYEFAVKRFDFLSSIFAPLRLRKVVHTVPTQNSIHDNHIQIRVTKVKKQNIP